MARGEAGVAGEERQLWKSPCAYSGAERKENKGGGRPADGLCLPRGQLGSSGKNLQVEPGDLGLSQKLVVVTWSVQCSLHSSLWGSVASASCAKLVTTALPTS